MSKKNTELKVGDWVSVLMTGINSVMNQHIKLKRLREMITMLFRPKVHINIG